MSRPVVDWHHAPLHLFEADTVYMVTAGALHKQHFFRGNHRLGSLQKLLFEACVRFEWQLIAWAVFSNHHHFLARSPGNPETLSRLIQQLHSKAAKMVNRLDGLSGRQAFHQYWDRCLTFAGSYCARVNYVNNNAVHHGLVRLATDYPFCSARHFEAGAPSAVRRKLASFSYGRVKEPDNFEPVWAL